MVPLFQTLARYNRWANDLLFQDMALAPAADLARETGANFGSIIGIMNHLLLGDALWMQRFTGEGEPPESIEAVPHPELSGLARARRAADERIVAYAEALVPQDLDRELRYTSMAGKPFAKPMHLCLAQFFNHQTHHRGQVHALLGASRIKARDIDLIFFPG